MSDLDILLFRTYTFCRGKQLPWSLLSSTLLLYERFGLICLHSSVTGSRGWNICCSALGVYFPCQMLLPSPCVLLYRFSCQAGQTLDWICGMIGLQLSQAGWQTAESVQPRSWGLGRTPLIQACEKENHYWTPCLWFWCARNSSMQTDGLDKSAAGLQKMSQNSARVLLNISLSLLTETTYISFTFQQGSLHI